MMQILGRILNRFSNDMGAIDELLPRASLDAVQVFLVMSGILMIVFIVSPWMIAPSVALGLLFYYLRVIYLKSAQDVKRLEGVSEWKLVIFYRSVYVNDDFSQIEHQYTRTYLHPCMACQRYGLPTPKRWLSMSSTASRINILALGTCT